jgi:RHS repeat-associated protein
VTGTTLGGVTDAYTYDANGLLASYVAEFDGSLLYSETIDSRDGVGRITQKTDAYSGNEVHVWTYAYDAPGRLIDVTEDGQPTGHYEYDLDDNRTLATTAAGGTATGSYDPQDRMTAYGGATYTYGANGELQTKTDASGTASFTYDSFGNLRNVTPPTGSAIDYVIDGMNRRVGRKAAGTLVQGLLYENQLNAVAELDGAGNLVAQYVYGTKGNVPDVKTDGSGTYRILSDHLGSARLVVNTADGTVAERMDFDEWGNVTADAAPGTTPYGFAGGLYDRTTTLTRFGARDYDPTFGRWAVKDPIRFDGGQINIYVYADNDPVNESDPTGLDPNPGKHISCLAVGGAVYIGCIGLGGLPDL